MNVGLPDVQVLQQIASCGVDGNATAPGDLGVHGICPGDPWSMATPLQAQ